MCYIPMKVMGLHVLRIYRIDFNGRVELFLAKHLGGRAEEFVEVEGATARFPLMEKEVSNVEKEEEEVAM